MKSNEKIALVTGGSRGIGRAISVKLAEGGVFVFVNFRENVEAASETLEMITRRGGRGEIRQFDVSDFETSQEAIKNILREKGAIDILVNNAAVSINNLLVRTKEKEWDTTTDINLKGVFNCCRAVARPMIKQRWGRIINISSVVACTGNAGQAVYAASKAGIIGLTKSLARELGSRNICVNAVAPGFIETDMTLALPENNREQILTHIPLARSGTPDDVANVVAFLISEEADYITGQVINVNGGMYM